MSRITYAIAIIALLTLSGSAQVVQDDPAEMRDMGIEEHLGDTIPLDIMVTNDAGETVPLSHYFHRGKPVIGFRVGTNDCSLYPFSAAVVAPGAAAPELSAPPDIVSATHRRRPRETTPHGTHHEGSPAR